MSKPKYVCQSKHCPLIYMRMRCATTDITETTTPCYYGKQDWVENSDLILKQSDTEIKEEGKLPWKNMHIKH